MADARQAISVLFNAAALAQSYLDKPKRVTLDGFQIDCTLSESHSYDAEITEFPVEKGADISDHRHTRPVVLSISGIISDSPLDHSIFKELVELAAGPGALLLDAKAAVENVVAGKARLSSYGYEALLSLYNSGQTFSVGTPSRHFSDMLVQSLHIEKSPRSGRALQFSAVLRQVQFVETSTSLVSTPAVLQAKSDRGQRNGAPAAQSLKDKASAMFKGTDAMFGGGKAFQAADFLLGEGITP